MKSEDIERAVRRRVRRFDGVFAADRLPNDPCLLVCNTDPSHNPGEHWVAHLRRQGTTMRRIFRFLRQTSARDI